MSAPLQGKVILITGGTSGMGAACTRHFAALGAKVVCASNQQEAGAALAAELRATGHEVTYVFVDIADENSVANMAKTAVQAYGRIDGVHCNAGVWRGGKVTDLTDTDWNLVMGVNVKGTMLTLKHAIPYMQEHGGTVVITTSVAAFVGFPEHALYCASKAALEALIRCVSTDYAGSIRVVGVCPGTIDTPMLAASAAGWTQPLEELYNDVRRRIPVRRLGEPMDIAKAVAFLLSDDAGYINGTSLVLDGGTMALPPW